MKDQSSRDIAIIGMACRFPQANTIDQYWQNLIDGTETAQPVPADRWQADDHYDPKPNTAGKSISKWGGFLDEIWAFDSEFFGLTQEEALFIDPQHRILLELAYETLADSGYTTESFNGKKVGVFIAIAQEDYKNDAVTHLFSDQDSPPTTLANNLRSLAAGRIADSLNLKGPTFAIDSACSSALIAMHYARLSLQNGDCDFAFVGGVNLNIGPTSFLAFSNAGALSPTAKSYLFDERNQGILLGEGAGMLLLTPEQTAERPILALLKGSAINNDGKSHGPMTPNTAGQQQVMQAAYDSSAVDPALLGYLEAHATGTPIGDVVEARTLNRFFSQLKEPEPTTRYVGSVKPNIGHLLSAAGIASLIKVILALHHKQIPPSLNCQQPRRRLKFKEVGLLINAQPIPWPMQGNQPRLAGINAFAFGGTNAHVILQEAPHQPKRETLPPPIFNRKQLRIETSGLSRLQQTSEFSKPLSSWLQQVVWQPTPLTIFDPASLGQQPPTFLIAADKELGEKLVNLLKNQGLDCDLCAPDQLAHRQNRFRVVLIATDHDFIWSSAKSFAQLPHGTIKSLSIICSHSPLDPDTSLITGLGQAINDELHIPVQFIGFDGELTHRPLFAELLNPTISSVVWWQNNVRLARKILPLTAGLKPNKAPLSHDGVYLITGGGSGVGAAIAKGLTLDVAPTLILVGRKSLSDALERADLLEKLRWADATADYVAADVTDQAQVIALIHQILTKYGRLDGVIHAAGVVVGERLETSTVESHQQILAPKVHGVQNLHLALTQAKIQPKFFVNFSSISAILPGFSGGLSSYAAANSYLDAFACQHGYQSLNWTIWTESGQGAANGLVENLARLGLQGVGDKEGYELFKSAISLPINQVVIANPEPFNKIKKNDTPHLDKQLPASTSSTSVRQPIRIDVFTHLTELLADELDIEPAEVPLDQSFANMGLDSMGAMELVIKLEEKGYGNLPPTLFFEHNTITKLANHLSQQSPSTQPVAVIETPLQPSTSNRFPLTPVQRSFLTQHIQNPNSVAYTYLRISIKGDFCLERGNRAVEQLFINHPQLRASFVFEPGGIGTVQEIVPFETLKPRPKIELIDLTNDSLDSFEERLVNEPMGLLGVNASTLSRVICLNHNGHSHLAFMFHHIVADGWSLSVLVQEFWASYFATDIEPLKSNLNDYENVLAREKQSSIYQNNIDWWRQHLKSYPNVQPVQKAAGKHQSHRFKLDQVDTHRIKEQAKAQHVTLFHWLLAAQFKTLKKTNKKSGLSDLVIGVAEARRDYYLPQIERLVGCLSDIFPLWLNDDTGQTPLGEVAQCVKEKWLEVHPHTHLPSAEIGPLLPASKSGQPLYSAAFSFSHFPRFVDDRFEIIDILGRTGTAQTNLSLVCWTLADELYFAWNYRDDLYSAAQIEQLTGRYLTTLGMQLFQGETDGTANILVPMVPTKNGASRPRPPLFLNQIANQIEQSPNSIAIRQPETTYRELANQIKLNLDQLHSGGFKPQDTVAFIGEPAVPALSAMLATFWGGGTWLPLDPATPAERLAKNLQAAGAKFLLGQTDLLKKQHLTGKIKLLTSNQSTSGLTSQLPPPQALPDRTAYIIFTSGSTGEQKGVKISYDSLDGYLAWAVDALNYRPDDVQMWGTSLSFDATLRQCLAPLITGGSMLPLGRNQLLDPTRLSQTLAANRVTKWSSVPTLWKQMLNYWEQEGVESELALRQVQLGGEALSMTLVDRWIGLNPADAATEFVNLYGPTENTINATYFRLIVADRASVHTAAMPIGQPLKGVRHKVIDAQGKTCAPGDRGELLIGGRLLMKGYLGDEAHPPVDYYPSGDLVELLPDQNLLFIGRLDNQIKLKGYRIELEEIEQQLLSHPQVTQAAVVLRRKRESGELVAFVSTCGPTLNKQTLANHLAKNLPNYMIPACIEQFDTLPILPNGKVDRTALKQHEKPKHNAGVMTGLNGSTDLAGIDLKALWQTVLKVEQIDPGSDFFALGGDSLNIMELMVLLRKAGCPIESPADLFTHRTLQAQSDWIGTITPTLAEVVQPVQPVSQAEPFPLSEAQVGFWMAHSLKPNASTTWHASFWLDGVLDRPKFTEAAQILVGRHPMLRTVLVPGSRPPRQQTSVPGQPLPITFETADLDPNQSISQLKQQIEQTLSAPFDLAQWPLIRLHLVQFSADQHLWCVAGDHFIGDGLSGWIFGRELFQIYDDLIAQRSLTLKPLEGTFHNYIKLAQAENQPLTADAARFWQAMFGTSYSSPHRWKRPEQNSGAPWHKHIIELDTPTTDKLKATAVELGLTTHDLLLALFYQQLARLTEQHDLIIGTAVSGRDLPVPDLLNIFGSFATILPLRFQLDADEADPRLVVGQIIENARRHRSSPRQLTRLAHPDLSLESLTGTRFFFSFIGFESMGTLQSENLSINWERSQSDIVPPNDKTDVMLVGRVFNGKLRLTLTAGAHALDRSQLKRFAKAFRADVDQAIGWANDPNHLPNLDSALIGYLPNRTEVESQLKRLGLPFSADQARGLLFPTGDPQLLDSLSCALGRSGTVTLPIFADELAAVPTAELCTQVTQAAETAVKHGASSIALAGMLPSLTDYGHALPHLPNVEPTTGHSVTVVAVVRNTQHAISRLQLDTQNLTLAFLGCGSIGSSALRLFLRHSSHPAALILCDVAASDKRLQRLEQSLRGDLGFAGEIVCLHGDGQAPAELHSADVIVGATSQPNLLDVAQLRPGTLVIDDSFPPCFDQQTALARMQNQSDVLLVGGGLLDIGQLERAAHVPGSLAPFSEQLLAQLPSFGMASCQLEGLLRVARPELPPTLGLVNEQDVELYWQAVEELEFQAAPLHLGGFLVDDDLINTVMRSKCRG